MAYPYYKTSPNLHPQRSYDNNYDPTVDFYDHYQTHGSDNDDAFYYDTNSSRNMTAPASAPAPSQAYPMYPPSRQQSRGDVSQHSGQSHHVMAGAPAVPPVPPVPPMPSGPSLHPAPSYSTMPGSTYSAPSYNHHGYPSPMPSYGNVGGYFEGYSNYNQHSAAYNAARQKMMKRRSVKKVELQQGNLVLDCPVPQSILQYAKDYTGSGGEEFKKMRYTAVTGDPDDFMKNRYSLRPFLYGRQTELAIAITMYNEDEILFCRSMNSIVKNIQHLQSRNRSKTWGDQSWEKVVLCIVSDGRSKINPRVLKVLGLMGVYQDGIAKDTVAGKDVSAHIFEYSTQVYVDAKGNVSGGMAPIQVIFCLKEQNKKKLNSHRWFFNAICRQIQPNVTVLVDAGTKPSHDSIYHLWKAFDKHPHIGGACGEITVDTGRGCVNLINPLVAAQNFEYKISNILDKPLESVFGYISVLPGAFSAYRYKALLDAPNGKGPLNSYFKGEKMHEPGAVASAFDSNMYLAEDRILCFEIVAKKHESWTLQYVKSAKASTDVPARVPEFVSQRRRWLNGSLFASVHATICFFQVWTSGQNFFRKIWLQIETIYGFIQLLFTWIAPSSFFLAIHFVCLAAISDEDHRPFGEQSSLIVTIVEEVYIGLLFVSLICALGNRPQGSNLAYTGCLLGFGLIFCFALFCAGWTVYLGVPHTSEGWSDVGALFRQSSFRDIVISLAATYGLYFFASFIHLEPWHMFTSFLQYMFILPFYINVLAVYSMCNLHDVSWGTKGQSSPAKDLGGAKTAKDGEKELVEVEMPTQKEDIDSMWVHMQKDLSVPAPEEKSKRDAQTKQEDQMRNFRTNIVLAYMGTNIVIAIFFSSEYWEELFRSHDIQVNPYSTFIFWTVAGLAAFRAFGSITYLILRLFGH